MQSVTLGWDPSSDPNVGGYNIYYGTESGQYTTEVPVGNGSRVVITGLVEGTTYYFAATTVDVFGYESGFSEEALYTVPIAALSPPFTNNCLAGQDVALQVLTDGSPTLIFEWQFNAADIPSATNSILAMTNITVNQAGTYTVTVSNGAGVVTNFTIFLAVYPTAAPTLTPAISADGQFAFNVSGIPGLGCLVQGSTNLVNWESVLTNVAPFVFTDPDASRYCRRFYRTLNTSNPVASLTFSMATAAQINPFRFADPDTGQF